MNVWVSKYIKGNVNNQIEIYLKKEINININDICIIITNIYLK